MMRSFLSFCEMTMNSLLSLQDISRASSLLDRRSQHSSKLDIEGLRGQLTEFSSPRGHTSITLAAQLIYQAQKMGGPAAWIGPPTSFFYPPDMMDWGVDWSALALIRVRGSHRAGRAADKLLRSGGFELVVIDLPDPNLPSPLLGRLLRLAETHKSAVIFLTPTSDHNPSLSSLVTLRARLEWTDIDPSQLRATFRVIKDKRRGPGRIFHEVYDGPMGLR